jgi:hypothetical protein
MEHKNISVEVRIVPNGTRSPKGKLASAEVLFAGDPLDGLRLVGFGVWEKSGGGQNVTFPARQYMVDGKARMFGLLQPGREGAQNRLRQLILIEYAAHDAKNKAAPTNDEFPDLPRP